MFEPELDSKSDSSNNLLDLEEGIAQTPLANWQEQLTFATPWRRNSPSTPDPITVKLQKYFTNVDPVGDGDFLQNEIVLWCRYVGC